MLSVVRTELVESKSVTVAWVVGVERAFKHIDVVGMARGLHRGEMVRAIDRPEALDRISGLVWTVLHAETEALITTDRPLVVPCRGEHLTLTMALSPCALFVAHPDDASPANELQSVYRTLHARHNSMLLSQGSDFVYSSRPIERSLLELVERSLALPREQRDIEGRIGEIERVDTR